MPIPRFDQAHGDGGEPSAFHRLLSSHSLLNMHFSNGMLMTAVHWIILTRVFSCFPKLVVVFCEEKHPSMQTETRKREVCDHSVCDPGERVFRILIARSGLPA